MNSALSIDRDTKMAVSLSPITDLHFYSQTCVPTALVTDCGHLVLHKICVLAWRKLDYLTRCFLVGVVTSFWYHAGCLPSKCLYLQVPNPSRCNGTTLKRNFLMVVECICQSSKLCYAHPAMWTRTVA